jgi:hypothetical protein
MSRASCPAARRDRFTRRDASLLSHFKPETILRDLSHLLLK